MAREEFGSALSIGGAADHVHLLISLNTRSSAAEAVGKLKSLSSGWIHDNFNQSKFAWQDGYGVFSVSQSNVQKVRAYIENQAEHHRKKTFEEEYLEFLKRHNVKFDPLHYLD